MNIVIYVLYIGALVLFFASAYFNNWLADFGQLVSAVNTHFWAKLPFEFQAILTGVLAALVVGLIASLFRSGE